MKKKVSLILWLVCIAIYILNIVIICLNGATLANNILAWVCSIMLAINIILLECWNNHLLKARKNDLLWWSKILEFVSDTKQELEDQTEQKTENKEVKDESI